MADLGQRTIELCSKILKRIKPELKDGEEKEAVNNLEAWLHCCQIETELLEAEENLDDLSRQYLLTVRNKLNNRNYLSSAAVGPSQRLSVLKNGNGAAGFDHDDFYWMGPVDECTKKLFTTTIRPETIPTFEETAELKEEMAKLYSWDEFNVFKVTILTNGHPLEVVAMKIFEDLDLFGALSLDKEKFRNFVRAAELTYRPDNPYHNNIHAADVTQSLAVLLSYKSMSSQLKPLEKMAIVLAAISHDIGHPGLNNDFLVNSGSEEAKIYHDRSVNENMHLRYTFKLLEKEENNFIANLSREDWWFLRQILIKTILGTDMATHTSLLAEFENHVAMHGPNLADWNHDHRVTALTLFVHCADIANPAKPGPFARAWAWRVMQEFYSQGDKEREMKIRISPACQRGTVSVPRSQLAFLQYCVRPVYEALSHMFSEITCPLQHIEESVKHWKEQIDAQAKRKSEEGSPVATDGPAAAAAGNGHSEEPPPAKILKQGD